jgi:DNA polymerase-3 subunit alpha
MDQKRKKILQSIDSFIIDTRYNQVDPDYLEFEIKMSSIEDLERMNSCLINGAYSKNETFFNHNPHNSILLYVTGLTSEFDFKKARSDTIGGSPPDIDIDHDALDRETAIDWCIDYWGQDNVANIITHGTFKPKSLARSFYRITDGDTNHLSELLDYIPPPKFGKESTLEEILDQHPELEETEKFSEFLHFADRIEGMVSNFGIHAAGLIISDNPIKNTVPLWKNKKSERITQFDKDECEELGLIKFDFLGIDTLSIVKECTKLIYDNHEIQLNPYAIPDFDTETYLTLEKGLLTGVFQMETSGMAKELIIKIKPKSIEDLSAISALNRPGPLQAGLDKQYILNKYNNFAPEDLPDPVAEILKNSYWTLVYQEQVMEICSKIAGFTPKESDDIRRAMGKKKVEVLNVYKTQFISGCINTGGLSETYSNELWDNLVGFADYCLAATTKINTSQGVLTIKDIVDNKMQVEITSYNKVTDTKYSQQVTQWHERGIQDVFKYTLKDGSEIKATEDHKFLTNDNEMLEIETIYKRNLQLKK